MSSDPSSCWSHHPVMMSRWEKRRIPLGWEQLGPPANERLGGRETDGGGGGGGVVTLEKGEWKGREVELSERWSANWRNCRFISLKCGNNASLWKTGSFPPAALSPRHVVFHELMFGLDFFYKNICLIRFWSLCWPLLNRACTFNEVGKIKSIKQGYNAE